MVDDDPVRRGFLRQQYRDAMKLAAESDVLQVRVLDPDNDAPICYHVTLACTGSLRSNDGSIQIGNARFDFGILFAPDYLRRVDPYQLVTWLAPHHVANPHIKPPLICLGRIRPGTPLVDLVFQVYEIVTFANWTPADPLDSDPRLLAWAAANQTRFPLDRRPLRRPKQGRKPPDCPAPATNRHSAAKPGERSH